ncbi:MAG: A24 family peptidase [Thermoguttaceae bacterium]
MNLLSLVFVLIVAAFVAVAAISDLRTRRLPNWLTVPALAAAIVAHTAVNGLAGLGFALLGFVTGFGILLILWLVGGGGGGDVKLMGALGAWLGSNLTIAVFLTSTMLAVLATAAILLGGMLNQGYWRVHHRYFAAGSTRRPKRGESPAQAATARRERQMKRRLMPYAVPVAIGTWLVLAAAWMASDLPW